MFTGRLPRTRLAIALDGAARGRRLLYPRDDTTIVAIATDAPLAVPALLPVPDVIDRPVADRRDDQ